jgi:hypothetical protein
MNSLHAPTPRRHCLSVILRSVAMPIAAMFIWTAISHSAAFAQQANRITWSNPDPWSLRVSHNEVVVNNVHFDLLGFARAYAVPRGGDPRSVSVYLVSNNAYGWRMKYRVGTQWRIAHFDMMSVAIWQGQRNFGGRPRNYGFYFTNFASPYSWRGVYILQRGP